ncbi:DUF4198 domain-containing protein [Pseudooceanicola sp.]|uniref:DUF4198 domain-containing protein n=1 Tax=Pseudooceanicola sp. TaxID=1914328 RepID=UPI00261E718C|nr:DUF4198 domain-containing protein [Pseudooceanicola sp.]
MSILKPLLLCALVWPTLVTVGKAHEFWIEPENFQPAPETAISADLRNGQNFAGSALSWFDPRNVRVEWHRGDEVQPITGRPGDIPALSVNPGGDGLLVLAYQTTATLLTYKDWDTVLAFAAHKDFPWFAAQHAARGLPQEAVKEVYTRYCKSLVGIGDGAGSDVTIGFAVEFLALSNPYQDDLSEGFRARLLYQGQPLNDSQVEVFDKAPDGSVIVTRLRTDAAGEVRVPVSPGHRYLLDHVVLREPDPGTEGANWAMWESLWASLTFAVPQ